MSYVRDPKEFLGSLVELKQADEERYSDVRLRSFKAESPCRVINLY